MERYRIRDWDKHFENSRSREIKNLTWIAIPNKQGSGYRRLIAQPNGPAMYGTWCAIVAFASRCDPRGSLVHTDGSPYTIEDISAVTGIDPQLIHNTILFVSNTLDWIEGEGAGIPQASAGFPPQGAGFPPLKWIEGEGTGLNRIESHTPPATPGAGEEVPSVQLKSRATPKPAKRADTYYDAAWVFLNTIRSEETERGLDSTRFGPAMARRLAPWMKELPEESVWLARAVRLAENRATTGHSPFELLNSSKAQVLLESLDNGAWGNGSKPAEAPYDPFAGLSPEQRKEIDEYEAKHKRT